MLTHGGRQREVVKCGGKVKKWADVVTQNMVIGQDIEKHLRNY